MSKILHALHVHAKSSRDVNADRLLCCVACCLQRFGLKVPCFCDMLTYSTKARSEASLMKTLEFASRGCSTPEQRHREHGFSAWSMACF